MLQVAVHVFESKTMQHVYKQSTLTSQLILERQLNVTRIKRRRLNKAQPILTSKLLRLLGGHRPQMPQIALVATNIITIFVSA